MVKNEQREVTLWPSKENYPQFRALCDDDVPETFDEFAVLANRRLQHVQEIHGVVLDKLAFDPDRMAAWCRARFGTVDAEARRHYAASIARAN
jgi:hypothetical protein